MKPAYSGGLCGIISIESVSNPSMSSPALSFNDGLSGPRIRARPRATSPRFRRPEERARRFIVRRFEESERRDAVVVHVVVQPIVEHGDAPDDGAAA